jgi:hypothetical protein
VPTANLGLVGRAEIHADPNKAFGIGGGPLPLLDGSHRGLDQHRITAYYGNVRDSACGRNRYVQTHHSRDMGTLQVQRIFGVHPVDQPSRAFRRFIAAGSSLGAGLSHKAHQYNYAEESAGTDAQPAVY